MEKTIMIAAIAVSFVVGIFVSPNMATAHLDLCAKPSVNSEKSVWHALCDLQTQIQNIPREFPGIGDIKIKEIADCDCEDPFRGWDPPDEEVGIITDDDVIRESFIAIMTISDGGKCTVFRGEFNDQLLADNQFGVDCSANRENGSRLKYMIVNPSQ